MQPAEATLPAPVSLLSVPPPALSAPPPALSAALPVLSAPPLGAARVLRAAVGMAGLGAVAALGGHDASLLSGLEAGLVPVLGTGVLTAPALLVAHQYLNLQAEPRALLQDLGQSFCRVGDVALGLVPVVGLFVLTTDIAPVLFGLLYLAAGALGLGICVLRMEQTERLAGTNGGGFMMLSLGLCWAVLAGLIGLRLCVGPLLAIL